MTTKEDKLPGFKLLRTVGFILILLSLTPAAAKTVEVPEAKTTTSNSFLTKTLSEFLAGAGASQNFGMDKLNLFLKTIVGSGDRGETVDNIFKSLILKQLLESQSLKSVAAGMGVNKDLMKPFAKIISKMAKLSKKQHSKSKDGLGSLFEVASSLMDADDEDEEEQGDDNNNEDTSVSDETSSDEFKSKLFDVAKEAFEDRFGTVNINALLIPSATNNSSGVAHLNATTSSVWMIVKSTWQRVLAYVKEENSLEMFMKLTPVKIIDKILSLGDDVNLVNFLAKKLDPDFAEFLADKINPYLGPLKDFDTFYNFTKEKGLNGIIDYFSSEKFTYTINAMSNLISAYFEDTVSDDIVNQYIELISFDNIELQNFYKSVLRSQGKISDDDSDSDNTNATQRYKRDVLQDIANSYKYDIKSEQHYPSLNRYAGRQIQRFGLLGSGTSGLMYDPSRDGGYGGGGGGYGGYGGSGGGYGGSLDPYVILGSLALGTILGFLLFRALRGTGGGRRDIGDGSLSLWQSDIPEEYLPWNENVERMKRDLGNTNSTGEEEAFILPGWLRGYIWSTEPLVEDNLLGEGLEQEDVADQLNHLWRIYRHSNETTCVQSHLCDVMAKSNAEHLTGRDSSIPLIMASVSSAMGLQGQGQMMDDVISSVVAGNPFSCPTFSGCLF